MTPHPVFCRACAAVLCAVLLATTGARSAGRAWITILSTTDLHGNIYPIDYYTNQPDNRGLAKIATLIRKARAENPGGTLLVDSGDVIQGSPLEYVHKRNNSTGDPMMRAMSLLGFDAMTVGNHEYDFGLKVLEKARREARFPWLSANTYKAGTNTTYHRAYVVKELKGVRVGILGLTTPAVPVLENKENYAGLEFREPVIEARKWVRTLKDREHADLVVIAMHMGLEEDPGTGTATPGQVINENRALAVARQVPGVDLILMGHTHRDVPAITVNGVLLTQANFWGYHLSRSDVSLEQNSNRTWRVVGKESQTIAVQPTDAVDEEIAGLARTYDRETRAWLARVIGDSDAELTASDARVRDTALLDLVQRVQLDAGHADVSMAANFNRQAHVPKGPVTVRDIAGLYIYENTLVVLDVTGRQLQDALEHSARFFREYVSGRQPAELVDDRIPDYNFDQAEGVTYELDITRPAGQRIRNLRFEGRPVTPTQRFRLATNNYRMNGGGGYTMLRDAPVLYRSSEGIREMIIDWVEHHKHVPAQATNNWSLIVDNN